MSDKASALSTDQIDIENGERYDIKFTDKDGTQKHPLILHCSPSGAIERVIYALLEKEAIKMQKGQKPMLPLWLSPTQVRFIPVKDKFVSNCEKFIEELNSSKYGVIVRADIDDREESVGKKIRDAETEWVPIILVIGDKELESNSFTPRFRDTNFAEKVAYSLDELNEKISETVKDYPQNLLPLPMHMSKRVKFK